MQNPVFASSLDYETYAAVEFAYPQAYVIVEVCGGWLVFFDVQSYEIWSNQK